MQRRLIRRGRHVSWSKRSLNEKLTVFFFFSEFHRTKLKRNWQKGYWTCANLFLSSINWMKYELIKQSELRKTKFSSLINWETYFPSSSLRSNSSVKRVDVTIEGGTVTLLTTAAMFGIDELVAGSTVETLLWLVVSGPVLLIKCCWLLLLLLLLVFGWLLIVFKNLFKRELLYFIKIIQQDKIMNRLFENIKLNR